jgi:hypothetical protein
MRRLFGCLAALLGAVSISLAARYGYKGADTTVDGAISAIVFGSIALCAFIFDAAAVRLWFMRHRLGSVAIGAISAAALVVTFTNSLGAIAGRADTTQAERARAKDTIAADRAELKLILAERASLPLFTPADEDSVRAFEAAVMAAERARAAECDKRGPRCRERETEEAAKRDALAATLTNKALVERAGKLDRDAAAVRARLATALPVHNPNPLGAVLELLLGAGASVLTAWQQAIVAAVFELCLVGVMVIYELLGHAGESVQQTVTALANAGSRSGVEQHVEEHSAAPTAAHVVQLSPRKAGPKSANSNGSVSNFVRDQLFRVDGERVEMKALMQSYRAWCAENNIAPVDLNGFLDEIDKVCRRLGIIIEPNDDQRVYCVDVKLKATAASG